MAFHSPTFRARASTCVATLPKFALVADALQDADRVGVIEHLHGGQMAQRRKCGTPPQSGWPPYWALQKPPQDQPESWVRMARCRPAQTRPPTRIAAG